MARSIACWMRRDNAVRDPSHAARLEQRSSRTLPAYPAVRRRACGQWLRWRLRPSFNEVVEILPLPPITPVPGAQSWMLGVGNVRGNLLPIVDLKQFLEGERTVLHETQRVLIVRQPDGDVAVTIDELFGQRSFQEGQQVDPAAFARGRYAHFVERAYRLADHTWGVFSLARLARTPEFRQAAA